MVELVILVLILGMIMGGGIGYSIASYFELRYLEKMRKDLEKYG